MNTPFVWPLIYFAPALVGWFRHQRNPHASIAPWKLFALVLFLGWTVIGWFVAWRLAFRDHAWSDTLFASGDMEPAAPAPWTAPTDVGACQQCSGTGKLTCTWCAGRGSYWEAPQTAEGTGQQIHCSHCVNSGRLTCGSCNGTGQAR